jgi:hypothetical protein
MPQWLIYLRIGLAVVAVIRQLKSGKDIDAAKVLSAIEPAFPAKFKSNLTLLTADDIKGIQEAFLTLGNLVAEKDTVFDDFGNLNSNKLNMN